MKKIALLIIGSFIVAPCLGQEKNTRVNHKGFYLSLAIDPAFGDVKGKDHYKYPFTAKLDQQPVWHYFQATYNRMK